MGEVHRHRRNVAKVSGPPQIRTDRGHVEVPESALTRRKPLTDDRTDHEIVSGLVASQHRQGFREALAGIRLNQNATSLIDGREPRVVQDTRN